MPEYVLDTSGVRWRRVSGAIAWRYRSTTTSGESHMSAITNSFISRSRLMASAAVALGAIALVPPGTCTWAAWCGSSLGHPPANAGSTCSEDGVGSPGDLCTHVGSDYPGFSGHAQSKTTGMIVQLKVRPEGPMRFTAQVVNVRHVAPKFK